MTQIINEKLKKCCNQCNKYMDSPCAWLSLGNEYCDEIMEVNKEIERLSKERSKTYENGLNYFLELQKKKEEIERLNNIINKAKGFIKENCILSDIWEELENHQFIPTGRINYKSLSGKKIKELLEILNKGE